MSPRTQAVGAEIRRRRLAAGYSLSALASRVHYTKGYLSRVENGSKTASPELVRLCDTALGAQGALRALAEPGSVAPDWCTEMNPGGPEMGRREVLAIGGSLPVLAVAGPAPTGADGTVTSAFTIMLQQLRNLGQSQPPAVLLPVLDAQVRSLLALARAARSAEQAPLLMLSSRFAEFTGWMAQESGDEVAMTRWTRLAVRCADAAGDRELAAYAHIRHANAALYRADAETTVDLAARAAQTAPDGPGGRRIQALALQRQAQGHALRGRHDDCHRALDAASEIFGQLTHHSAGTVLGTTTVSDPSDLVLGWCLHDLGRSEDAVPVLRRHLARVPAPAHRARTRVLGRLALATAGAADPATACALAHEVLDDAQYLDSATLRHDLRHLGESLKRWRSRPDVQSVKPRLVQALKAS